MGAGAGAGSAFRRERTTSFNPRPHGIRRLRTEDLSGDDIDAAASLFASLSPREQQGGEKAQFGRVLNKVM